MAIYKNDIVDINLESGSIHRSFLNHTIGTGDNIANHFGVRAFRNGEPVNLEGGSVQGYFRDPRGNNIAITSGNIVSGNTAVVVLPQACYNYEGQFCLAIKLVGDGVTGTVRIVDGMVDNTHTGGAVAPTETVPTYQEVLAVYDQMVEAKAGSVRFDITQELTDTQEAKARENIGAASDADLTAEETARQNADNTINGKIGNTTLPTTAQTLTGAIAEHETDITGIDGKIGNTALPTTAQTLTGAIAEHETDIAGLNSALDDLRTDIVLEYDSASTYDKGDYVSYDGNFYRAKQDITTAEAWTSGHWTLVAIGNDIDLQAKVREAYLNADIANEVANRINADDELKSAIKQIADDVFSTEFVHLADNKMASGSIRGIDYSVVGNTVTLNGTATGAVRLKVSGNSFAEGTSVEQAWLSESIGLVTGHKYAICAELVSGTLGTTRFVIYGSESTSAVNQLEITASTAQKGKVVYGSEFVASSTNCSAFVIYMANGWTATNVCIKFDLLDFTAAESFIFEKIGHDYHIPEQIIQMSRNALFPLGYKDIITKNGKMDDYNGITAEVNGNRVKLNGTCTSAIRLKLTNDIEYAHSVDSNWYNETIGVPNNNHTFIAAVSGLAGTGSSEEMDVVFYNESGSSHGIRLITSAQAFSLGMKYSDEITNLSELNCLCIYIKTGVVLNNVELQIGLYDITEMAGILDFAEGDPIPSYYFASNYLPNKISSIENIGASLSVNSLRFVFNTDYHMAKNANISPALIKKIAEDTGIKTVIFNGDYMVSETTPLAGYSDICDFISLVTPLNEVADVHFATGNHEWNDPSASHSERRIGRGALIQLLNAYDSKITMLDQSVSNAFYIDFGIPKIRCYCIDMEYNAYISMDTRTKMFESLLSVPDGYAVFVCSHGAMKDATNAEITGRFGQIMECCAALNDGVPVTLNDVTYDFTNKARTFIGALTGHTHVDGYLIYDDRFPVIVTECDAWNAQASGGTRTSGTVDEQAFEVVQIDVTARRIYLTRIGHGNDRTFSFGVSGAGLIT